MREPIFAEFIEILKKVQKDTPVYFLCAEILEFKEPDPNDGVARFSADPLSLGLLAIFVGRPLWVWAEIKLNALREREELNTAMLRIKMMHDVSQEFPELGIAENLVNRTMEVIAKRDTDDPALGSILEAAKEARGVAVALIESEIGVPEQVEASGQPKARMITKETKKPKRTRAKK